jgi:hypothetical protein
LLYDLCLFGFSWFGWFVVRSACYNGPAPCSVASVAGKAERMDQSFFSHVGFCQSYASHSLIFFNCGSCQANSCMHVISGKTTFSLVYNLASFMRTSLARYNRLILFFSYIFFSFIMLFLYFSIYFLTFLEYFLFYILLWRIIFS